MSGWHRLWVFISVLLLLVAIAFGWLLMPRTDQGVLRNLETAECKYLTTLPEGFKLDEYPKFDHPCYSLAYLRWTSTRRISNASDYKRYLREKQYRFLGIIDSRISNGYPFSNLWEAIMYCPPFNDASCTPFLEGCAYKFGLLRVSYEPLASHRVSRNRFLTLMVDLEHPLDDLVELFKNEVRRVTTTRRRVRKRLDKVDEYLPCWDHAQKGWTLREIAKEVYPQHWAELPEYVEELSIEPTPNEIKEKAKELRQMGQCANTWSFKQAREDLKEEKLQLNKISAEALRKTFRERLKARGALRKKVWRNIQAAHRRIQDITPQST